MQVQTTRGRSAMLQEMVVTIFLLFLKQTPGWHLKHWLVHITFLHFCPSTSRVPPPFFVNSSFPPGHSVLFLQLYLLSLPHLLYSFPATRTQSSSVLPTQQGCSHPQQPTRTAVNSNTNLSPSRLKIFPQDGFSTANCEFWLLVKARFAEKQSY